MSSGNPPGTYITNWLLFGFVFGFVFKGRVIVFNNLLASFVQITSFLLLSTSGAGLAGETLDRIARDAGRRATAYPAGTSQPKSIHPRPVPGDHISSLACLLRLVNRFPASVLRRLGQRSPAERDCGSWRTGKAAQLDDNCALPANCFFGRKPSRRTGA